MRTLRNLTVETINKIMFSTPALIFDNIKVIKYAVASDNKAIVAFGAVNRNTLSIPVLSDT